MKLNSSAIVFLSALTACLTLIFVRNGLLGLISPGRLQVAVGVSIFFAVFASTIRDADKRPWARQVTFALFVTFIIGATVLAAAPFDDRLAQGFVFYSAMHLGLPIAIYFWLAQRGIDFEDRGSVGFEFLYTVGISAAYFPMLYLDNQTAFRNMLYMALFSFGWLLLKHILARVATKLTASWIWLTRRETR